MDIDKLNLEHVKIKRHPLGYYQVHGKFKEAVPSPIDEHMRHEQLDFDGVKVEVYPTGFHIMVMRDFQVQKIGNIIEKLTRHKPTNFIEKIKRIVVDEGRAVKEDFDL